MKKFLLSALALAAIAACEKEPQGASVPQQVRDVNFEDGDQIGLSIFKGDAYYAENSQLSFSDGVFSGSLVWYPEAAESSVITAYYPTVQQAFRKHSPLPQTRLQVMRLRIL